VIGLRRYIVTHWVWSQLHRSRGCSWIKCQTWPTLNALTFC